MGSSQQGEVLWQLTARETAILCLIATGYTSDQVANVLHLSYHTVAQHIAAMLRKSGTRSRGELIARCFVAGILDGDRWPPSASRTDALTVVALADNDTNGVDRAASHG